MKPAILAITLTLCLAAGAFLAAALTARRGVHGASPSSRRVLYYTCPMHPQYRSDRPGNALCCGMGLVPVYDEAGGGEPGAVVSQPGTVRVNADMQQGIGIRTDLVRRIPVSHRLRVPGRVAVDDGRLFRLIAAADGWVRELGPNTAGSFVEKDQVLASYYTSNLLSASQTMLYALATSEQAGKGNAGSQPGPAAVGLQVTVESLRSLGMSDAQIEEIRRTRQVTSEIRIHSPAAGFVLTRNLSPGQRFDKGVELYRIADIRRVWVLADIFEKDREFVKAGAIATIRYRGREFLARMGKALPLFDPQSRTLKTRFELDNPGYTLRPDEFVDVEIQVKLPAAITAPADSVIDSGLRKVVYVHREGGSFEPRLVKTGWRLGDRVQIIEGLEPGDEIVVAGNFLIDSESRMKQTASGPQATIGAQARKDPVCGMDVDPNTRGAIQTPHGGKTFTFCARRCKEIFEADPKRYTTGGGAPRAE